MDNPIYVMMPVLCVGKMCSNCPHIVVKTDVVTSHNPLTREWTDSANLVCGNVNKCMKIKQLMEEYNDKRTGQNP